MPLAMRHRSNPTHNWASLPSLSVQRNSDAVFVAALQGKTEAEMHRRFAAGHRAYVAYLDGLPVAWGWVATRAAEIGELGAMFFLPRGDRYLWNFVTLKSHRGMGIYPRLLDAIMRIESAEAERFWIVYAPENHASGSGIRKAGFAAVADLSFDAAGRPSVRGLVPGGGAAAARLLGLPEVEETLAPCWRCVRAASPAVGSSCSGGECTCDYQHSEIGCAA